MLPVMSSPGSASKKLTKYTFTHYDILKSVTKFISHLNNNNIFFGFEQIIGYIDFNNLFSQFSNIFLSSLV